MSHIERLPGSPASAPAGAVPLADPAWLLRPRPLMRALFVLLALFLCASVGFQLLAAARPDNAALQGLMRATNVDREGNLPSLYNTLLLLAPAGLLAWLASLWAADRPARRGWRLLSWVFVYLAADEYLHWHELLMTPLRQVLGVDGFLRYAWVVPYAGLVLAVLLGVLPLLRRLERADLRAFLIAGGLYVMGAMGLELVGGQMETLLGVGNALVLPLTTLEEALEMTGLILFIGALLRLLVRVRPGGGLTLRLPGS